MKVRKILALVMVLLMLLAMTACGAASMDYAPEAMDNGYGTKGDYIATEDAAETPSASVSLPENRKLIQTVRMHVETEDLDAVLQQVDSRIAELGGYIENSNVQNGSAYSGRRYRSADITVRIPAKDLDSFVNKVGEISNIVSSQKNVEDITLNYVATESRMKALQTEEARLLELLAKAETMEDLLTVEKRLTEVRTELEQVTSALRVFDNQVDYATIHLNISEVTEYTDVTEPETVWQRIGAGFKKSLKGVGNFLKEVFVILIVAIPYLALIGAFALIIVLIIRTSIRRKRRKQAKEREARRTPPQNPQ